MQMWANPIRKRKIQFQTMISSLTALILKIGHGHKHWFESVNSTKVNFMQILKDPVCIVLAKILSA